MFDLDFMETIYLIQSAVCLIVLFLLSRLWRRKDDE